LPPADAPLPARRRRARRVGDAGAAPAAGAVSGGEEAEAGAWPWQVALEVVVHEAYDTSDARNDIALLELDRPLDASDDVAPVAVPAVDASLDRTEAGDRVVVTGFGAITEGGAASPRLRQGEVEALDDGTCADRYAEDGEEVVAATQVCAGLDGGGTDACFGDSGGPLVAPADDEASAWYLVGIVSWGDGCGRPRRPTVYTEVAAFSSWLRDNGALTVEGRRFDADGALRVPALGTRGKAGPYPSTVEVRGVDGDAGPVAVELHGLDHDRPADLDVWLEAPDGTVVTLLSDVGGRAPVRDLEVVVRADAPPAGDVPLALAQAPSNREPDRQRRAVSRASLRPLAGIDPNGEWRLHVADDRSGAAGRLDGWTLVLG